MKLSKAPAAMDVWCIWIEASFPLEYGFPKVMFLLKSGDCFLLRHHGCASQAVPKYF